MGKGFNNYMCKKFFHPASRDNLKRVWMAEQQTASYKQKQEELRVQYEKEQDLYTNKAMMSKESKEKLSVNFLYEPPPGHKKDREREDDEPEFKFEWQRKYNAPRESYCKGDQEIRDQPFGIQVRNVRCIKCHKWGHINTDKECPMYNQSATGAETGSNLNPSELIRQMREDGLAMKKGAVGLLELPHGPSVSGSHQLIASSSEDEDHMNETELKFLEGLSTKKKLKLLKKLEKMEKKKKKKKKKHKEKKNNGSRRHKNSSSDSDGDSDSLRDSKKKYTKNSEEGSDKGEKDEIVEENCKGEGKDMDHDLYTVLGRKMDFEGRPQDYPKKLSNGVASKGTSSYARSVSKERIRPRSPNTYQKYDQKCDSYARDNYRRNQRRSRSLERRNSNSEGTSKAQNKYSKGSSGKDRSLLQGKVRRRSRSRSRSRERRRRSRSPGRGGGCKY